jgi:hypothetical protein
VISDELSPVSDVFTALHQEKYKAILNHLDDDLVNSHPAYLTGQWPTHPKFDLIRLYFLHIRSDVPPKQHYGLNRWDNLSSEVFNDLEFDNKTGLIASTLLSASPNLLRDMLAPLPLEAVKVIGTTCVEDLPHAVCNTDQEFEL